VWLLLGEPAGNLFGRPTQLEAAENLLAQNGQPFQLMRAAARMSALGELLSPLGMVAARPDARRFAVAQ
jgi:hypothetical protein